MTTATAEPSAGLTRAVQLHATLDKLAVREAELAEFVAGSPAREHEARTAALRAAPSKLPGGRNNVDPVAKERQARADAERELESVRLNTKATLVLLAEEEEKARDAERKRLGKKVAAGQDAEREAWRELGAAFGEFIRVYADVLKPAIEGFDSWRERAQAAFGTEAEEWRQNTAHHVVEPIPSDLKAMIETLLAAACDIPAQGFREGTTKADTYDELRFLVPDLSGAPKIETLRGPRRTSDLSARPW